MLGPSEINCWVEIKFGVHLFDGDADVALTVMMIVAMKFAVTHVGQLGAD
jgi:hypothetical protein